MRVLLIEDAADGLLDLAIRAKRDGHDVRYFNSKYDTVKHPIGKGIVERVPDWRASMRWCDIAVFGGNGKWLQEIDRWKQLGVRIIGGCEPVAKLELDRLAGMKAFQQAKIPVAPYRHCRSLEEAIRYVQERDEGCAIKFCGDVSDKSTSVVGKTAKEVLFRLYKWRTGGRACPEGLLVQDRIEGTEFGCAAWVGPDGFATGFEETWEGKRAFAGDLGPNTGESHSALRFVRSSKIANMLLKPFEDYLVSVGYTGNISINAIVTDDGQPIPLEWTCRLGWPSTNLELALHRDPIDFLCGLAEGDPPNTRQLDTLALGIVLCIPPYPFPGERAEETVGVPIWGVTPSIEDNMHWAMVQADKDELATAGTYIGVSVGTGATVVQARDEALRVLNRLTIPASPYWRVDACARLRRGLPRLQENGFATGVAYA